QAHAINTYDTLIDLDRYGGACLTRPRRPPRALNTSLDITDDSRILIVSRSSCAQRKTISVRCRTFIELAWAGDKRTLSLSLGRKSKLRRCNFERRVLCAVAVCVSAHRPAAEACLNIRLTIHEEVLDELTSRTRQGSGQTRACDQ